MSTIVTRAGKGSPLSNTEMDSNLTNLNTDKLEASAIGVSIQAYSANLTSYATTAPTAAGLALLDDANAAAQRTTMGVAIGTDVMAYVAPSTSGNVLTSNGSAWVSSAPAGSGAPTGSVFDYVGTAAPTGYVLLSGRTIGSASSGATERANSDTQTLYELLWNSMTNTEAPVSGGRGASGAADFAANKTITLPDARGRVIVGKDNMGGTTASRITSGGSGITGTTLGTAGGTETHTLTAAQSGLPSHSHSITYMTTSGGEFTAGSTGGNDKGTGSGTGAAGGTSASSAHQNTQPSLVLNKIIKL
jgi:microcystin-dependent protein